jgi:hypothetical protein
MNATKAMIETRIATTHPTSNRVDDENNVDVFS